MKKNHEKLNQVYHKQKNHNLRIVFMGTPDFAVPSLQAICQAGYDVVGVITQPDRPRGRGQKIVFSPVKETALQLGLDIYQPVKVREESFIKKLAALAPDLIVVVAFGQILPQDILDLPPLGCVNVHASLLPAYRGAAPIHWAIMNGEKETGVTTMLMDKGLDTGDMLLKEKVEIPSDMTCGELHDILAHTGASLLLRTVELWKERKITPTSQDGFPASYAPLLKREHELIHWAGPAEKIHNQVRGLEPWPGAYTMFRGSPLKIRRTAIWPDEKDEKTTGAPPGTVLALVKGRGFVVQTGQGSILVTAVQSTGKKVMPAEDFINGYRLEVGYVFRTG